jgi:hypothetical protein
LEDNNSPVGGNEFTSRITESRDSIDLNHLDAAEDLLEQSDLQRDRGYMSMNTKIKK